MAEDKSAPVQSKEDDSTLFYMDDLCVEDCGSEEVLMCDQCIEDHDEVEAQGYCQDCSNFLCASCFKTHLRPQPLKNHRLLDRHEMPKVKARKVTSDMATADKEICHEHGKVVEYYCEDHRAPGCSVCVTLAHRSCNITFIPSDSTKLQADYQQLNEEIQSLTDKLQGCKTKTKASIKQADVIAAKAINDVTGIRNILVAELDKIQKEHLAQVKELKKTDKNNLDVILKQYGDIENAVTDIQTEIQEKNTSKRQSTHIFIALRRGNDRVKEYRQQLQMLNGNKTGITSYHFQPSDTVVNTFKAQGNAFGTLVMEKPTAETKPIKKKKTAQTKSAAKNDGNQSKTSKAKEVEDQNASSGDDLYRKFITDINVKAITDKQTCVITGITMLDNQRIAISDFQNSCIKILDTSQNLYKLKLKIHMNSPPYDLAFSGNKLAITQPAARTIMLITETKEFKACNTVALGAECRGIAYCDEKFFVSLNANPAKIQVMTTDGEILSTHTLVGGDTFHQPFHLAVHPTQPQIFVSDWQVTVLGFGGTLVRKYRDPEFKDLRGISVSTAGNLYVCDMERNAIYVVLPTGGTKQVFLDGREGIRKPYSLLATGRNKKKLYVGMDQCNVMKVFQISKK